jgi:hypothetical protein
VAFWSSLKQKPEIAVLDGNPQTNTSSFSTTPSIAKSVPPAACAVFDQTETGNGIVAWAEADGTIRAAQRSDADTRWGTAKTIASAIPCNSNSDAYLCPWPAAALVNPAGKAVIGYVRWDPTGTVATLYASTN